MTDGPDPVTAAPPTEWAPDEQEGDGDGEPGGGTRVRTRHGARASLVGARAVLVLAAAAAAYPAVVPSTHVDRSRLALLVPARPGLAAFAKATHHGAVQPDSSTGLAAVTAAAKRSASRTGVYSALWSVSQASAGEVVAFLLPTAGAAAAALPQIERQQMGATSYHADLLDRTSTGIVGGIPGSHTASYRPVTTAPKGTPSLAVTAFRYGEVDAVSEVAGKPSAASFAATSLAHREHALLERRGGRLSLVVTDYPLGATIGWAAGAVVVAVAFALLPLYRRRRREKRRLAYEAELANRLVVKGKVITKHRL